jgi:putative transposase
MNQELYALLSLLVHLFLPRHSARIQFLLAQIRILRARLESERIVPTPEEKAELLRWGALFEHDIQDVLEIVKPATYRRWLSQTRRGKPFKRSGRPRITEEIRQLVLRMAKENALWGYRRIAGELKKLDYTLGLSSVKRILRDFGIFPAPKKARKQPPLPWTTFVHAHLDSMIACDFFSKPVWTLRGRVEAYVMMFICLGTRKVCCSSATQHPDGAWVMQQARNASIWIEEQGVEPRLLVRDGDRKFPDAFKDFWAAQEVRVIRIPPRSPMANAFAENWIGGLKRECLNFFTCFSRRQLDHIVRCWTTHYNTARPNRGFGMDNRVLDADFRPQGRGEIHCKEQLGGLIKSYYREAA